MDVRSKLQFEICALENSISIYYSCFYYVDIPLAELANRLKEVKDKIGSGDEQKELYVICRRGNDSQHAAKLLISQSIQAKNISGGLLNWNKEVDSSFPVYWVRMKQ